MWHCVKKLILMKKILIISAIFIIDRIIKVYLINLQDEGTEIDFYVSSFLNIYLVWNTGIGFGLISSEADLFYHALTTLIIFINLVLIYLMIKTQGAYSYFIAIIIGGAIGNLFDRVYYYAVPDFIDFHIGDFHWFIFNIADIFITIGIIALILIELVKNKKKAENV